MSGRTGEGLGWETDRLLGAGRAVGRGEEEDVAVPMPSTVQVYP